VILFEVARRRPLSMLIVLAINTTTSITTSAMLSDIATRWYGYLLLMVTCCCCCICTGAIEFKQASMRYRSDTDLVLRGVDLSIKPGEKVNDKRTDKRIDTQTVVFLKLSEPPCSTRCSTLPLVHMKR
jgi:ABC-type multidrug transport system fused ATPase/permease subunit